MAAAADATSSFDNIILKVKEHPELWQPTHPYFKNRHQNARTWYTIANELKMDEKYVRKKWKHLRDQYKKEKKKIDAKTIPMSFWKYYKSLQFLSDDTAYQGPEVPEMEGQDSANDKDYKSDSDSDDEPLLMPAKRPKKADSIPSPASENLHLSYILKRLNTMEEQMERCSPEEEMKFIDPDYMYILSILPMMKKLTEIQKLQFRGNINDWLLEIVTQNEFLGSI